MSFHNHMMLSHLLCTCCVGALLLPKRLLPSLTPLPPSHPSLPHTPPSLTHTDRASSGKLQVGLNLNVLDGLGETPLGLALWTEQFDTALRLLQMGAELESGKEGEEPGLLYVAIVREKPQACLFLLDHGADFKTR